jgi:cell division protein FtsZ
LSFINKTLSDGLEGLIETIYEPGLINIDFADLRTILSGQGKLAFLNSVDFEKSENPGLESIEEVLNSPLFPYNVEKAKGILLNIVGEKDLKLSEVNQILNGIQQKIHKDAKIIFGVSQPAGTDKTFKVTILATGCVSKEDEGGGAFGQPAEKKDPVRAAARKTNEPKSERQNQKKTKNGAKPKKPAVKTAEKKTAPPKPAAKAKKAKTADKPPGQPPNTRIRVRESEPASGKSKSEPDELKDLFKPVPTVADKMPETEGQAVRKNAMQVKKDMEQEEREMLEREKMWDIPAFLRKRPKDV